MDLLLSKALALEREGDTEGAVAAYKNAADILFEQLENKKLKMSIRKRANDNLVLIVEKIEQLKKPQKTLQSSGVSADNEFEKNALDCIMIDKPEVTLSDVIGLDTIKNELQIPLVLHDSLPGLFDEDEKLWNSVLLYGPPGTGKTFIASALAHDLDRTFITVSLHKVLQKYVGESEKQIHALFQVAKDNKPCIMFFDEVESLFSKRGEGVRDVLLGCKTQLLVEMNNILSSKDAGVFIIAATNHPEMLDDAFIRRFDLREYVPLPEKDTRLEILKKRLTFAHALSETDLLEIAALTENYSADDLCKLINTVAQAPKMEIIQAQYFVEHDGVLEACSEEREGAFRSNVFEMEKSKERKFKRRDVVKSDFVEGMKKVAASTSKATLETLNNFAQRHV